MEPTIPNVTAIVSTILSVPVDELDPDTSIFDLGANSLNATELAWRLSKAYGQRIESEDLYQVMTISGIVAFLSQRLQDVAVDRQKEVDALIEEFSVPFTETPSVAVVDSRAYITVLLTGATGSLGSHMLAKLLTSYDTVVVICLVRGDPLPRLHASFDRRGLDPAILDEASKAGKLQLLSTSSLADKHLGTTAADYARLLETVDIVIHSAWRLDFNIPLSGFKADIGATRSLAELCACGARRPSLNFTTSISTTFGVPEELVPERPLEPLAKYALSQGYALAKVVTEHTLYRLHTAAHQSFPLRILRVGQLCGDTLTGFWSTDEMAPMLLASIPALRAVPREMPDVSWIPTDVCAHAVCELALHAHAEPVRVFNLANPTITSWPAVCAAAAHAAQCPPPAQLPFAQYVRLLESRHAAEPLPILRLLPYFKKAVADHNSEPGAFRSFDVSATRALSPALAACPPIDAQYAAFLMRRILLDCSPASPAPVPLDRAASNSSSLPSDPPSVSDLSVASSPSSTSTPASSPGSKRYVFLFGPWSERIPADREDSTTIALYASFLAQAHAIHPALAPADGDGNGKGNGDPRLRATVEQQLRTLAHQLVTARRLHAPCAVAGYSFGEFAAAAVAGLLSDGRAVELVLRRAVAVHERYTIPASLEEAEDAAKVKAEVEEEVKENDKDKDKDKDKGAKAGKESKAAGAMLNVFAPARSVRARLATLPHPGAELAIHAGPAHMVLAGRGADIARAQAAFEAAGAKCVRVTTGIPFHCRQMAGPVAAFGQVLPQAEAERTGAFDEKEKERGARCVFVSGLTGRAVPAGAIGPKYWLRHMREPVRFVECMETIRRTFCGEAGAGGGCEVVDIGPGPMLRKVIGKYGWEDVTIKGAEEYLHL
ncbi:FabD/lysophospholipase-like protein [Dentipellis sp. KUC8613]|nr:FabD/lysophospholipase-like protein [Dentipellis sp. KUC8613]